MNYNLRLQKLKESIKDADYILIGAGAGLSTAAGINYGGKRFLDHFMDYNRVYGIPDMYSGMFYPFKTPEEKWAYRARHVNVNYYLEEPKSLYKDLLEIVSDQEYFVLTTNGDGQFYKAGYDPLRIFSPQGNYSKFQCSKACHKKTYDNHKTIQKMLNSTKDFKIPTSLIPTCPRCGEEMTLQLRVDDYYVEDTLYQEEYKRYVEFTTKMRNQKVLLIEIGVGYNTPGIIKYPFERLTYLNNNTKLVRMNKDYSEVPKEIKEKSISFNESLFDIFGDLKK